MEIATLKTEMLNSSRAKQKRQISSINLGCKPSCDSVSVETAVAGSVTVYFEFRVMLILSMLML